jgi:hypothetical protein
MSTRTTAEDAPHSWDFEHWPPGVYPHSPLRAKYLIRANREALVRAGALTRIGREIVVLGAAYTRWLQRQAFKVAEVDGCTDARAAQARTRRTARSVATADSSSGSMESREQLRPAQK